MARAGVVTVIVAATGPSPLWYLTRGTGLVALVLLTATVALGVGNVSRWARPGWPRFATAELHRSVSLLVVVVLALHIVTAEADTFAPVGWLAVVVPFASPYRPIWLGLGTVAFDLVVALVVTSLLRHRLGYRTWRALHWAAYLSWPVAVAHGLGTGTDSRLAWVKALTALCVAAVLVAVAWRLAHGWPSQPGLRLGGGIATVAAVALIGGWASGGPWRPGWAKRAGTPPTLLATARTPSPTAAAPAGPPSAAAPAQPAAAGAIPPPPFSAALAGTLTQRQGSSGQVTVTVTAAVSGAATGTLVVVLSGRGTDGGVSLESSRVTLGTPSAPDDYQGAVTVLDGDQLAATVRAATGAALDLSANLQIDPTTGAVRGTISARAATGTGGGATSDGDTDGSR